MAVLRRVTEREILDSYRGEVDRLHREVERLRSALREAIGWSYGEDPTPERRDELERLV